MPKNRTESLAMLKEAHTFPCTYMFKVIGANTPEFVAEAMQVLTVVLGAQASVEVETRLSEAGRHQGVTLRAKIHTAEQVLDIYDHLGRLNGLKMVL